MDRQISRRGVLTLFAGLAGLGALKIAQESLPFFKEQPISIELATQTLEAFVPNQTFLDNCAASWIPLIDEAFTHSIGTETTVIYPYINPPDNEVLLDFEKNIPVMSINSYIATVDNGMTPNPGKIPIKMFIPPATEWTSLTKQEKNMILYHEGVHVLQFLVMKALVKKLIQDDPKKYREAPLFQSQKKEDVEALMFRLYMQELNPRYSKDTINSGEVVAYLFSCLYFYRLSDEQKKSVKENSPTLGHYTDFLTLFGKSITDTTTIEDLTRLPQYQEFRKKIDK